MTKLDRLTQEQPARLTDVLSALGMFRWIELNEGPPWVYGPGTRYSTEVVVLLSKLGMVHVTEAPSAENKPGLVMLTRRGAQTANAAFPKLADMSSAGASYYEARTYVASQPWNGFCFCEQTEKLGHEALKTLGVCWWHELAGHKLWSFGPHETNSERSVAQLSLAGLANVVRAPTESDCGLVELTLQGIDFARGKFPELMSMYSRGCTNYDASSYISRSLAKREDTESAGSPLDSPLGMLGRLWWFHLLGGDRLELPSREAATLVTYLETEGLATLVTPPPCPWGLAALTDAGKRRAEELFPKLKEMSTKLDELSKARADVRAFDYIAALLEEPAGTVRGDCDSNPQPFLDSLVQLIRPPRKTGGPVQHPPSEEDTPGPYLLELRAEGSDWRGMLAGILRLVAEALAAGPFLGTHEDVTGATPVCMSCTKLP